MKFSQIISLAQSGDLRIGAVSLKRMEILWAGAAGVSIYVLIDGLWVFEGAK